jgi:hypothetical protein
VRKKTIMNRRIDRKCRDGGIDDKKEEGTDEDRRNGR